MTQPWISTALGKALIKSDKWIDIEASQKYNQVTVKMWGKGVELRNEVLGSEIAASKRLRVKSGQFILSRIDARHGALGLIPNELDGAIVTNDFPVFSLNKELLLPEFLNWITKTKSFVDICRSASEGTTNRVRLKEDKFLATEILLPSIAEQQRIVARIERLTEKIEEAQELRRHATQESQALISSIHLNLASSKRVKLSEILTLDELQEEVIFGKRFPQVGVKGFGGGLFSKESIDSTQTTYRVFNKLYDGALVLSQVKGWEGAIAVCPTILVGKYVSPEYRTFRCVPGCAIPEYLSALVTVPWFWNQLKNLTRGMGGRRERIRPEQFLNMKIPLPSFDRQKYAISFFEKISNMQIQRNEALRKIEGLLPTILDKAFKGEF